MPPKKKSKEEILARKRELERKRYERIKNNPELYEIHKNKNKEKYQNRKQRGLVPTINELSQREKRMKRRKWREDRRMYYQRKKEEKERIERFINAISPPESPQVPNKNAEEPVDENPQILGEEQRQIIEANVEILPSCSRRRSREVSPFSTQNSSASSNASDNSQSQAAVKKMRYKKDKEITSLRLQLQSVRKINETLRKQNMRQQKTLTAQQKTLSAIKGQLPKAITFSKQNIGNLNKDKGHNILPTSEANQLLSNAEEPSPQAPVSQNLPINHEKPQNPESQSSKHDTLDLIMVPDIPQIDLSHQSSLRPDNTTSKTMSPIDSESLDFPTNNKQIILIKSNSQEKTSHNDAEGLLSTTRTSLSQMKSDD